MQTVVTSTTSFMTEKAGKYLTFNLGTEEYGLQILKVREIIGLMDITKVPKTPNYIRGVINLRGKVISIVDLRIKFDMPTRKDTKESCIIVVDVVRESDVVQMGILVDSVSEVIDIVAENIEPAPSFGANCDITFILGMAKTKGGVKILLNIDQVLSVNEVAKLEEVSLTSKG